jgi:hypothetical protein
VISPGKDCCLAVFVQGTIGFAPGPAWFVMKLLLHIGTGKTGSSTIQGTLTANRDRLRDAGVLYPISNGAGNHVFLPMLVAEKNSFPDLTRRLHAGEPAKLATMRQTWLRNLKAELDEARGQARLCILTAEHLSFLNGDEAARLFQILRPLFESIDVLVYLRDPVDYAVSMYDTALKIGGVRESPRAPSEHPELDYKALLIRWAALVDSGAMHVRLFEKDVLRDEEIVSDFFDVLGLSDIPLEIRERRNEAMDLLGEALMRRVNRLAPQVRKDGSLEPGRGQLSQLIAANFCRGEKLKASPELAAAYEKAFRSSNEWVRRTYFPERRRLFSKKPRSSVPFLDIPDVYLDEMASALVGSWREMRQWQVRAQERPKKP